VARIVMAMSGGVDSSVAASLLCEAGHEVIGVFMRHGEMLDAAEIACASNGVRAAGTSTLPIVSVSQNHKQGCCSAEDALDARRVADRLGIPFYALDLSDDFGRIIDYFVAEYTAARTPNPCVMCNNWVKFGKLFEYADNVGAEFVATGHYARLDDGAALLRGTDRSKDQSYVLFGVGRHFLPRMLLPLGGYHKSEIREMARNFGLRVADKRDSQEICFVTSGDHAEFVRRRRRQKDVDSLNTTSGDIALVDGTIVGHHDGIEAFTIGQRKGLGIALGEPHYVTNIDASTRRVTLGRHEDLARSELTASAANWLTDSPKQPFRADVQIRYNSKAEPALVEPLNQGRFKVVFDEPRYGVAPGQAAVCYNGDQVLGGGWIE
jgi:tRNA-uridine 2-sulfurtransferase